MCSKKSRFFQKIETWFEKNLMRQSCAWKGPSKIQICINEPLRLSNFKIMSMLFYSWNPNYPTKVPSDLFNDEKIRSSRHLDFFYKNIPHNLRLTKIKWMQKDDWKTVEYSHSYVKNLILNRHFGSNRHFWFIWQNMLLVYVADKNTNAL
jgi:hypothetical protein